MGLHPLPAGADPRVDPVSQRGLLIGLASLAVVLGAVIALLLLGTPQSAPGPAAAKPGEVAADAVAPPPDPSSPLAIEIPGCVCHSDDPALVEQHAGYRMNQCFGCHTGGMPEMGG